MPTFYTYPYTIITEKGATNYKTKDSHDDFNSIEDWARANVPHLIAPEKPGGQEIKILELYSGYDRSGKKIR